MATRLFLGMWQVWPLTIEPDIIHYVVSSTPSTPSCECEPATHGLIDTDMNADFGVSDNNKNDTLSTSSRLLNKADNVAWRQKS